MSQKIPAGLVPIQATTDFEVYASAARTAAPTLIDLDNYSGKGIVVVTDITVNAGASAAITVTIEGLDGTSGKYYTILAAAAKTAVATTTLKVAPGLPVSANVSANDFIPRKFRVKVTHADTNPITYSIGASLVP